MVRPTPSIATRILLVEGTDDEYVTRTLCECIQSSLEFSIVCKKDVNQLIRSIEFEVRNPGLDSIGILVDANDRIQGRWEAISSRLQRSGFQTPKTPDPQGTVVGTSPRVGIWLMPDNTSDGELEDFVIQMIPDGDCVWPLAEKYINKIPDAERRFIPKKISRAQLYAWLAVRESPRTMKWAIEAKDLDVGGSLCSSFVCWLNRVFN